MRQQQVSATPNTRLPAGTLIIPGYAILWFMKIADILTTVVGLQLIPRLVEVNPIARLYMESVGTILGLILQGSAIVIVTTIVLEYVLQEMYRQHGHVCLVVLLRFTAYGTLSFLYGITALHNTQLIIEHFSLRLLFGV